MLELLWKILFFINLFYFIYIFYFYFVIPMTSWLGILLRLCVVIESVIVWQMEQPILLFILIVVLL